MSSGETISFLFFFLSFRLTAISGHLVEKLKLRACIGWLDPLCTFVPVCGWLMKITQASIFPGTFKSCHSRLALCTVMFCFCGHWRLSHLKPCIYSTKAFWKLINRFFVYLHESLSLYKILQNAAWVLYFLCKSPFLISTRTLTTGHWDERFATGVPSIFMLGKLYTFTVELCNCWRFCPIQIMHVVLASEVSFEYKCPRLVFLIASRPQTPNTSACLKAQNQLREWKCELKK